MTFVARRSSRGFTYLLVLVATAILGIALSAATELWSASGRRTRLAQADWAGTQLAQAIGSYYESSPGVAKFYPLTLAELLEDRRGPVIRRHLRTVYSNPFARDGQWELLRGGDARIRGVRLVVAGEHETTSREYVYPRPSAR